MIDKTSIDSIASGGNLIDRIDAYLHNGMLPLWAAHGLDGPRGGFHERLASNHAPIELGYRRLTVCGRMLFVYATAAERDLLPGARELADRIFHYLVDRFWDARHGGFLFKIDPGGEPLDRSKDLYGHAFALLGLAQYVPVSPDHRARDLLARTGGLIADRLLMPEGWHAAAADADWSAPDKRLLQNPHMHLLEANLAAHRNTGDEAYKARAQDLVALFRSRLRDGASGTLIEFRDERGRPDPARGHIVEPGHHFEWCWLLHRAARYFDPGGCRADAARLFDWAAAHGIDRELGGVFDQVSVDGAVIGETKRIWPLTEYIKARAARFVDAGDGVELAELCAALKFLFDAYLLPDGGWRERLRRDLTCYDDELPATTCYHILAALLEALAALQAAGKGV